MNHPNYGMHLTCVVCHEGLEDKMEKITMASIQNQMSLALFICFTLLFGQPDQAAALRMPDSEAPSDYLSRRSVEERQSVSYQPVPKPPEGAPVDPAQVGASGWPDLEKVTDGNFSDKGSEAMALNSRLSEDEARMHFYYSPSKKQFLISFKKDPDLVLQYAGFLDGAGGIASIKTATMISMDENNSNDTGPSYILKVEDGSGYGAYLDVRKFRTGPEMDLGDGKKNAPPAWGSKEILGTYRKKDSESIPAGFVVSHRAAFADAARMFPALKDDLNTMLDKGLLPSPEQIAAQWTFTADYTVRAEKDSPHSITIRAFEPNTSGAAGKKHINGWNSLQPTNVHKDIQPSDKDWPEDKWSEK